MGAILLLLILLLFSAVQKLNSEAEVSTVDVNQARNLLTQGHRYLDVRTEEEFKNGHVENALNIPYMFNTPQGRVKNPKFMDQVLSVCTKEDRLVVGCQSGVRSVYATIDLLNAEFKHACNMGGGYIAWVKNGFTVNKSHLVDHGEMHSHLVAHGEMHATSIM